jgi:hypothetical protein
MTLKMAGSESCRRDASKRVVQLMPSNVISNGCGSVKRGVLAVNTCEYGSERQLGTAQHLREGLCNSDRPRGLAA